MTARTTRPRLTEGSHRVRWALMGRASGGRQTAGRVEVVDRCQFPDAVADRFRGEHPEVHPEDTAPVEAAARQWFRLIAREPRRPFALPSESPTTPAVAMTAARTSNSQNRLSFAARAVPSKNTASRMWPTVLRGVASG